MELGKNEVEALDGFAAKALTELIAAGKTPEEAGDLAYAYATNAIKARRRVGIKADKS